MASSSISDFELQVFRILSTKFLRFFQSWFYFSIGTFWGKKFFLKEFMSFFTFFGYWVNSSKLFAIKTSLELSEPDSACPKEQFEEKSSFWKLFFFRNIIVHWTKKFQLFVEKLSARLSKLHPMFLLEFIEKKKLFMKNKKNFLNFFWTLVEEFPVFCRENFVGLSK